MNRKDKADFERMHALYKTDILCNNPNYTFEETRVTLVIDDLTHKDFDPNTCSNKQFYDKAEEQGTVFSLKGFEDFISRGELNALTEKLPSTQYLFPRFIRVYKHNVTNEIEISEERPEAI